MHPNRKKQIMSYLETGRYFDPQKGWITLSPEMRDSLSKELKGNKLEDGGVVVPYAQYGQLFGSGVDSLTTDSSGIQSEAGGAGAGALKGAGTGAAIGSIIPGIGTAIGAGVGAVVGGISGFFGTRKDNKRIEESDEKRKKEEARLRGIIQKNRDEQRYAVYPEHGNNSVGFYGAYGGKMKYANGGSMELSGGSLEPVASNVDLAVGNKHSQGGIQIGNSEIEGEEIVKDQSKVYSDRLMIGDITIAERAEELGKKKAKFEKKLASTDKLERETGEFMTRRLDVEMNKLFDYQEKTKINNTTNYLAEGGKLDKDALVGLAGTLSPYIDNLVNAKLIKDTPEIPRPELLEAAKLDTEFNITPQLASAKTAFREFSRSIDNNTSDSTDARANKIAGFAKSIGETNKLYSAKENIETQLANQDAINKQSVEGNNLALINNYNLNQVKREDEISRRKSANIANLTFDVQNQIAEKNMKDLDEERIKLDAKRYMDSGVPANLLDDPTFLNILKKDQEFRNELKQSLVKTGRKSDIDKYNELFPEDKIPRSVGIDNMTLENKPVSLSPSSLIQNNGISYDTKNTGYNFSDFDKRKFAPPMVGL